MKGQRQLERQRKAGRELPSPGATNATALTSGRTPDQGVAHMPGPHDPAGQRSAAKDLYLDRVGGMVLTQQSQAFVMDTSGTEGARAFALRESVQPRDAVEEMLLLQMPWQHARLGRLSAIAGQQENRENLRVVNDACDRAANTFRRQLLALAEYRRPPRTDAFVAIKQANLANQQVVQNVENQNFGSGNETNEQGSAPAKAVRAITRGAEFASPVDGEDDAVAREHRPQDDGREGPEQHECAEAR